METFFSENKTYTKVDFTEMPLQKGEYEGCVFINCNFSGIDLSETKFIDCSFTSCNLSLINLANTVFRDCLFKECKMTGLRFDDCNGYGLDFSFEHCQLNYSSFYKRKLRKIVFRHTLLREVDFSECDLTSSTFDHCDLTDAKFENTILEKADFRTSYNYTIDPENNRLRKAKFSLHEIIGLLRKYDIEIELR